MRYKIRGNVLIMVDGANAWNSMLMVSNDSDETMNRKYNIDNYSAKFKFKTIIKEGVVIFNRKELKLNLIEFRLIIKFNGINELNRFIMEQL